MKPATFPAKALPGTLAFAFVSTRAEAHASEQGFVLLLPTDLYVAAGVAVVTLTLAVAAFLPARRVLALYQPWLGRPRRRDLGMRRVSSCLAFLALCALVWAGMAGPHDPLKNLLPLSVWTVFWTFLVVVQAITGSLWTWIEPWSGPLAVARRFGLRPVARLPVRLAHAPALLGLVGFAWLLLIAIAPTDPDHLARLVTGYWLLHFAGGLIFGPRWIARAETFGVLMRAYGRIAPRARWGARAGLGLCGWREMRAAPPPFSLALFMVAMLAIGSFDGLNETFFWLGAIGVNPLDFPGRSAIVLPTAIGLAAALVALPLAFAVSLWLGLRLAGRTGSGRAFRVFAPSLLPIALGYHIGHYLPSFLVDAQYVLIAFSDPFNLGHDLFGMADHYVTTGFFNTRATVRAIWLSQAGAVVGGHVLAVLLAHALALREYRQPGVATRVGLPLAAMMVAYTLFGLWLLASPRGL
ncbi:MAG: hypothetical protein R3D84_04635 [Paracoccaceae bacterium]